MTAAPLSPARARQLIEWPTYEAIGIGNSNEPRCVDCHQRPSEHGDNCKIAQRNAALERLAVLEARIEKLSAYLHERGDELEVGPLHDVAAILKGDDQCPDQ